MELVLQWFQLSMILSFLCLLTLSMSSWSWIIKIILFPEFYPNKHPYFNNFSAPLLCQFHRGSFRSTRWKCCGSNFTFWSLDYLCESLSIKQKKKKDETTKILLNIKPERHNPRLYDWNRSALLSRYSLSAK